MAKMKINLGTPQVPNWAILDAKNAETIGGKQVSDFLLNLSGDALPVADANYRGVTFTKLGGVGVADEVYICVKGTDNNFSWSKITLT